MNKIHNIVWSKARNAWVVVAEGTKSASKAGGAGLRVIIALILLTPLGAQATTLPQGGTISVGQGTISTNGSNQMVIKQTSDKLGINWQSFNVGADGHVIFDQPGAHSIALNRVLGSDGSAILGKIDANGQIFLVNPNGVIFGKDSKVNVGGLVASTLDITDADFKNGNYKFTAGATSGEIANHGELKAAEGGYVALLGKSVKNNGVIRAKLGNATMAAGSAMTLDFSGDGLINVQVDKSAVNALVENKGLIQADGGSVLMTARASNALLNTVVNNEGIIQAQTLENRGGKIFLDGGMESGTVAVAGTLDASAPVVGNGGFIETSGANVQVASGTKITTLSKLGKTGDWLLDPTDFYIVSGNGALTSSQIGADTLQANLATTNVTLQTSAADSGQAGDINVNADVTWSANTKLTLNAANSVNFHANVTATGANAGIAINASGYYISGNGARIRLPGTNSSFSVNGLDYTMIRTAADLALLSNATNNQHFALANDIDASVTSGWNAGAGYIPPGGWDKGVIDGLVLDGFNNSITNLRINLANDYSGLIGWASNASLGNINVNANVDGFGYTGILAGYLEDSTVYNVVTSGSANGTSADDVGGVIGHAENLTMRNVTNYATVAGTNNVGGLLGYVNNSSIIYSYNLGSSVTGKDSDSDYTGGFAGYALNTSFDGLLNIADVNGANFVGGLFGISKNSTISTATSSGHVVGIQATGGLIGIANGGSLTQSYAKGQVDGKTQTGGLIGKSTNLSISNVYSTGNVTGTTYTGGLIGDLSGGTINQAFTTSKVIGTNYVGGFAGRDASGAITNAYASGSVTGTRYVGGFLGSVASSVVNFTYSLGLVSASQNYGGYSGFGAGNTITESFWDTQSSGQATSVHGLGKTTAQMHAASTFSNWNIGTQGGTGEIWRIYDGFTGPLMRFVMATVDVSANDKTLTYSGHAVTTGELNAGTPYGYSTGADPHSSWYDLSYASRADVDLDQILGGNTHGGGLAIRNAGTYTSDKFYSTQFGYDIVETAPKTIVVNKAVLDVAASGANKTYDGTVSAGVTLTDNRLGSDDLVVSSSSNTFADKNAGAGKTISVNGITVTGADAGNYTWNTTTTTNATITKRLLDVTAVGYDKIYDGTVNGGISFNDDRIAGDDIGLGVGGKYFDDKNVSDNKTLTATGVNILGADKDNYFLSGSTFTTQGSITKRQLFVNANTSDKTYDATTAADTLLALAATTATDGLVSGDSVTVTQTGSAFSDKNAGSSKAVSTTFSISGADADNYFWGSSASSTADIAKASLAISASGVSKVYDGTTNASAGLTYSPLGGDILTVSSGDTTFADKNAGTGKTVNVSGITVTGVDASNYTWNSSASTTATISKAVLDVQATGTNRVYDGTTTANVTFADNRLGLDDLSISGSSTFNNKNAEYGKAISVDGITVTGADAGNYTWNTTAATTADVTKAYLVVTVNADDKIYDGTRTTGVDLTYDLATGDDLSITGTGMFTDKNAGTGKGVDVWWLSVTGADKDNYIFDTSLLKTTANISKAQLDVSGVTSDKVYDGSKTANTALTDNRIAGDDLTLSANSAFSDKNAGLGKLVTIDGIGVTGADAGNYTWNSSFTTHADITKAALVISAQAGDKTYDGTNQATTTLTTSHIAGDDLVLSSATSAFADKNAGSNKTVTVGGISVTGADAANYTWNTTATTTGDIGKYVSAVTMYDTGKFYDGTVDGNADFSYLSFGGDDVGLGIKLKYSDKNASSRLTATATDVTASGIDAGNYEFVLDRAVVNATIDKRFIDVSAIGHDKTYDGTTSASADLSGKAFQIDGAGFDTTVITGVIAGDDLQINGNANFSDKNAGAGKIITVTGLNLSGADAGNYYIYPTGSPVQTTATIAKANLDITATAGNKVYDGNAFGSGMLSGNQIAGDDITLGYASASFDTKNAGLGKTVSFMGLNVTGADAANYTWSTSALATADITKAALTISTSTQSKTYDGTTSAITTLGDNRIVGDDLTLSAAGSSFSDKNAGSNKTVVTNGIMVTGADASNYTWVSTQASVADINKATLNVTATGIDKVYDGSTTANVVMTDNRVLGDDLLISKNSSSFSDKNAGAKTILVDGIFLTGADAGNYTWNSQALAGATISKANLNVSAITAKKTYDGTADASVTLTDNRIAGDNLTLSASGAKFGDKNAGTNKAVAVSGIDVQGADAQNYTWNSVTTSAGEIAKAFLNLTGKAQSKSYDSTAAAQVTFEDNRIAGDNLNIQASSAFADANAGTGKSVISSGISLSGADAQNYEVASTISSKADINQAKLVVSANPGSKVAGTVDGSLGWSLVDGQLYGSDKLTGNLVRAPGETVGNYGIGQGTLVAGSNYELTVLPGDFSITKPASTVNPELEQARDVVSVVTVTSKTTKSTADSTVTSVVGDYRLLNLGMKLPDDLISEDR